MVVVNASVAHLGATIMQPLNMCHTGQTYMVYRSCTCIPVSAICKVELYLAFVHEAQP